MFRFISKWFRKKEVPRTVTPSPLPNSTPIPINWGALNTGQGLVQSISSQNALIAQQNAYSSLYPQANGSLSSYPYNYNVFSGNAVGLGGITTFYPGKYTSDGRFVNTEEYNTWFEKEVEQYLYNKKKKDFKNKVDKFLEE